jgi:hypothetical protein
LDFVAPPTKDGWSPEMIFSDFFAPTLKGVDIIVRKQAVAEEYKEGDIYEPQPSLSLPRLLWWWTSR